MIMKTYDERARDILEKRDAYNKKAAVRNRLVVTTVITLVTAILIASVAAIASRRPDTVIDPVDTSETKAHDTDPATGLPKEYNDGVIGERSGEPSNGSGWYYTGDKSIYEGLERSEMEVSPSAGSPAEMPSFVDEMEPDYPYENGEMKAGTLTAGEWKDADNLPFWRSGFQKAEWNTVAKARSLYAINVVTVKVKTADGLPCFNCKVDLKSGDKVLYSARTDINGSAYLFYNVNTSGEQPDAVTAAGSNVQLDGKKEIEIEAEASENLKQLDLMLMIDTTGSMGDELEYIKTELADMVKRISEADEAYSIRVSVNFYRDEGDDYVVKFYDFRTDINDCLEQLKDEHAGGGGDTPEAVHTALENAITGHQWRDGAVKICFFVLDAPPHSEEEIKGVNESLLKSVKKAAELGVRIIPVASSGVDTETEVLLRSFAVMTGGTYIFITNHSGIGFGHKEAEVGEYTVETLNECMIRVVCEYCGIYHGEKIPYTNPHPDPDTQMQ